MYPIDRSWARFVDCSTHQSSSQKSPCRLMASSEALANLERRLFACSSIDF